MKFKLDENLGTIGRDLLEAGGHDVMTVAEQVLSGVEDERLFEVCRDEWRIFGDTGSRFRACHPISAVHCRGNRRA